MKQGKRKRRKRSRWVWAKFNILKEDDLKLRAIAGARKISPSRLFRELIKRELDEIEQELDAIEREF